MAGLDRETPTSLTFLTNKDVVVEMRNVFVHSSVGDLRFTYSQERFKVLGQKVGLEKPIFLL